MHINHATMYRVKRSGLLFLVILFVGLVCVLVGLGIRTYFHLDNIEVIGTGALFSADAKKLSTNVLFFPTKALEDELRSTYPLFETVNVYKKYPHTIVVAYTLRDPWVYLNSADHTYGVDEHGVVLGEYTPLYTHPVLFISIGALPIGVSITDTRVNATLSFLHELDSTLQVTSIKEYSKQAIEVHIDSTRVLLSVDDDDMAQKARALLFLINGFRIKGALPSRIDLRYNKPIIST